MRIDSGWLGPTGLLDRRVLPARLRELLILRTCVAAGNDYEWQLHVNTISARMGGLTTVPGVTACRFGQQPTALGLL